jgi:hypothetical protein
MFRMSLLFQTKAERFGSGKITEFNQYRSLLEWALASREAGELLPLPKEFRRHTLHPFRNLDSGSGLSLVS